MKKLALMQGFIIVGLVVLLMIFKGCYSDMQQEKDLAIMELKMEKQNLEIIVNKQGDTVATQRAVETSNQSVIRTLSDEKFDLERKNDRLVKKVLAFSSQITRTKIDSVDVPYKDTLAMKVFSDSVERQCAEVLTFMRDSTIRIPATAIDSTDQYSASLTAGKTGIKINSLVVNDSVYTRIIEKKGGFFRKVMSTNKKGVTKPVLKLHVPKTIEFQTLHTSPFVHVVGQTSIFYTPKNKPKWLLNAILVGGGILLGSKL